MYSNDQITSTNQQKAEREKEENYLKLKKQI
jgi:hypothetical protein